MRPTGRELADQKRSWFSHGELTPLSERGNAAQFENVAAVEVAVLVEVVMDRGMGSGKFLESFYIPEARHCPPAEPPVSAMASVCTENSSFPFFNRELAALR